MKDAKLYVDIGEIIESLGLGAVHVRVKKMEASKIIKERGYLWIRTNSVGTSPLSWVSTLIKNEFVQ
jgi:hypothetical protein